MGDARAKEIWVPQTTTSVTVQDGKVTFSEQMTMVVRPIKPRTGFTR